MPMKRVTRTASATVENPLDRLQTVRDTLSITLQNREHVEGVHQPAPATDADVERWIQEHAAQFTPHLGPLMYGQRNYFRLHTPDQSLDPLLAAFFPDLIRAGLKARLNKEYSKIGPGVAAKDKPRLIQDLDAQMESLEREEEDLIRRIHADGNYTVFRRREARIEIVLDVQPDGSYNVEIADAIERESDTMIEKFVYLGNDRREEMDKEKRVNLNLQSVERNVDRHPAEYVKAEVDRLTAQLNRIKRKRLAIETEMAELRPRRDASIALAERVRTFIEEQDRRKEHEVLKTRPGFGEPATPLFQMSEHVGRTRTPDHEFGRRGDWAK